jgi:hypothetical protein
MTSGIIVGYDPGGNDSHGVAELHFTDGKVTGLSTKTLRTVEGVIESVEGLSSLAALGVESLVLVPSGLN